MLTNRLRERLIALRDNAGMTNTSLARAAHQRQQDVSRFMLADMKYPPLDFLDALARVFQYSLVDLLAKDVPPSTLTGSQRKILANLSAMSPTQRDSFENLVAPPKAGSGQRRG